jgi:hypothetical protein
MQTLDRVFVVRAPLKHAREFRRWYTGGAGACLVLTRRGRLLEPFPTFGPTHYRFLARLASFADANSYALDQGFSNLRACR